MNPAVPEAGKIQVLFISPSPALGPLLQSQGIPHMRELAKAGFAFTLLSYEEEGWTEADRARAEALGKRLLDWGIDWRPVWLRPVPWRPRSMYEVLRGARMAAEVIREKGVRLVHCRSYLPAFMMLVPRWKAPARFLFDMRGFLPDEYVANGFWKPRSLSYRLTKFLEKRCLARADAIVVTSPSMRKGLAATLGEAILGKVTTIPNLVDTSVFAPDPGIRQRMRERHGLADRFVLLWLVAGITRPHLPGEIARFVKACKAARPRTILLVVTATPGAQALMEGEGLDGEDFRILRAAPEEVRDYILMGDLGINFCAPGHPGSAIKLAEYLACGLPVVVSRTVEQADALVSGGATGIVVEAFTEEAYGAAAARIGPLFRDPGEVRERCVGLARARFSLPGAVSLYQGIYARLLADDLRER